MRAAPISSSAKAKRAWTRLGFAIEQNTVVKRGAQNAASVEGGIPPGLGGTRDNVAMKSAARNRSINFVVIAQFIAYDKKVVIAFGSMLAPRPAPKQDDRARMQGIHESADRLF